MMVDLIPYAIHAVIVGFLGFLSVLCIFAGIGLRAKQRAVKRGWIEIGGGVYRLTPMDHERREAETYAETLFKAGANMRRDEVKAWLGTGEFDAEIARAMMRNNNRNTPPTSINGRRQ